MRDGNAVRGMEPSVSGVKAARGQEAGAISSSSAVGPGGVAPHAAGGLTPDGRLKAGKLAGKTMTQAIIALSWPILVESVLASCVGLVDTTLAARLPEGQAATDAVGAASYIMWFVGLVVMAIGVGATAVISRSVGRGRIGVANAALGQSVLLALGAGAIVGGVIALAADPLSRMMNLSGPASSQFATYLTVLGIGVPATSLLHVGIACARGVGDAVRPMVAMVLVNVINLVASLVMVRLGMGVLGIAAGTVIAHAVGAGMILWMAGVGKWGIRLRRLWLRPHGLTMMRLVRVGIPNFLETLGMWAGNFLVILMVGFLGRDGLMGAHIVAIRIEAFSFLAGFAIGSAAAALVGQYLGAGSPEMARRAAWRCTLAASTVMGVMGVVLMLMPRVLVSWLSDQPVHLDEVPALLFITGIVQVPFAFSIVLRSVLRGAGDVRAAMWLTWVTTYGVRLPLVYVLSGVDLGWSSVDAAGNTIRHVWLEHPLGLEPSLARLWVALCIEVVVRGIVFYWRFRGGDWLTKKV